MITVILMNRKDRVCLFISQTLICYICKILTYLQLKLQKIIGDMTLLKIKYHGIYPGCMIYHYHLNIKYIILIIK